MFQTLKFCFVFCFLNIFYNPCKYISWVSFIQKYENGPSFRTFCLLYRYQVSFKLQISRRNVLICIVHTTLPALKWCLPEEPWVGGWCDGEDSPGQGCSVPGKPCRSAHSECSLGQNWDWNDLLSTSRESQQLGNWTNMYKPDIHALEACYFVFLQKLN